MRLGHLRHRSIEGGLSGVLSAVCPQPVVVVRHRERTALGVHERESALE